jgi:DNA-directed RNA polymerase subunit RPC12/RpoP
VRVVFVGRPRRPGLLPVWYVLTLGIYRRVWLYKVNKELDGHAALGINHRLNVVLLVLPLLGPTIVTYQTTRRLNSDLHTTQGLRYGHTWLLWLFTFAVPIIGNAFHLWWSQDRLNRYWDLERTNLDHGIEVDAMLEQDKAFVVALAAAREQSYFAGSRFDRKRRQRRDRWARRGASWTDVQVERSRVRAAGGSTPVLPWLRPRGGGPRLLHVACGRCKLAFDVTQDPFAETPILCPRCGLREVIPSLRGDALKDAEPAVFAALQVDCPECKTRFHAVRDLAARTVVRCFECGHTETLPAPKAKAR